MSPANPDAAKIAKRNPRVRSQAATRPDCAAVGWSGPALGATSGRASLDSRALTLPRPERRPIGRGYQRSRGPGSGFDGQPSRAGQGRSHEPGGRPVLRSHVAPSLDEEEDLRAERDRGGASLQRIARERVGSRREEDAGEEKRPEQQ